MHIIGENLGFIVIVGTAMIAVALLNVPLIFALVIGILSGCVGTYIDVRRANVQKS